MTETLLRVRAFAKINLALSILGKRADGYHEIRTVFQSIDLCDTLKFRASNGIHLQCRGMGPIPREENLVARAARLLASKAGANSGVEITLTKRIPVGAGLGGGSSDAAATLLALNRLWKLKFQRDELAEMAADLGSDVPYFLHGGTALGIGRGEEVRPLPELPQLDLVVLYPGIQVSTTEAYSVASLGLTSKPNVRRIQRFCALVADGAGCLGEIFNDFETSILTAYPPVREAKQFLERHGATAALLCGSGSSVFGFFPDEESALKAARSADRKAWRAFPAKTLSRARYLQGIFG